MRRLMVSPHQPGDDSTAGVHTHGTASAQPRHSPSHRPALLHRLRGGSGDWPEHSPEADWPLPSETVCSTAGIRGSSGSHGRGSATRTMPRMSCRRRSPASLNSRMLPLDTLSRGSSPSPGTSSETVSDIELWKIEPAIRSPSPMRRSRITRRTSSSPPSGPRPCTGRSTHSRRATDRSSCCTTMMCHTQRLLFGSAFPLGRLVPS